MESGQKRESSRIAKSLASLARRFSPRMRSIYVWAIICAVILTITAASVVRMILSTQKLVNTTNEAYQHCQAAVEQLQESSDFLTNEARAYVTDGDRKHLDEYLAEVQVYRRRDSALEELHAYATNDEAIQALEQARKDSDELAEVELYALRLEAEADGLTNMPEALAAVELDASDKDLTEGRVRWRASQLVQGNEYVEKKFQIVESVQRCSELLVQSLRVEVEYENERLSGLLTAMQVNVLMLLCTILFVVLAGVAFMLRPIAHCEAKIREDLPLVPSGAQELRHLISAYNEMYIESHARTESLSYEAHNDALTGAFNRGAFESLLTTHKAHSALLLIDVDLFKNFNDTYGHEMGDAILIEVAATLYSSFRSTDFVCRIGGDEFAVIMTDVYPPLTPMVRHKLTDVADFLRDDSNGLPPATISVGVAFGSPGCADDELFAQADAALYEVKKNGRDGIAFYHEIAG